MGGGGARHTLLCCPFSLITPASTCGFSLINWQDGCRHNKINVSGDKTRGEEEQRGWGALKAAAEEW